MTNYNLLRNLIEFSKLFCRIFQNDSNCKQDNFVRMKLIDIERYIDRKKNPLIISINWISREKNRQAFIIIIIIFNFYLRRLAAEINYRRES